LTRLETQFHGLDTDRDPVCLLPRKHQRLGDFQRDKRTETGADREIGAGSGRAEKPIKNELARLADHWPELDRRKFGDGAGILMHVVEAKQHEPEASVRPNRPLEFVHRRRHGGRSHLERVLPTAAIIDSQSTKTAGTGDPRRYDGGRKDAGRKWHLIVDTMAWLLAVVVPAADWTDQHGVLLVLQALRLADTLPQT
jgi:hypothetical protein